MKTCAVQLRSEPGDVPGNLLRHVASLRRAAALGAELVLFPELSLTNFEPTLAASLAIDSNDPRLGAIQRAVDDLGLVACVGAPTHADDARGVRISTLIFRPHAASHVHSKTILHEDETSYFVPGRETTVLPFGGRRIAFGICYEAVQREHFERAARAGADLHVASVAKPQGGIEAANRVLPDFARAFGVSVVLANSLGLSDGFVAAGQSAAWDARGVSIARLGATEPGFVLFDTATGAAEAVPLAIRPGRREDLESVVRLFRRARTSMESQGSDQWNDVYPTSEHAAEDLRQGTLHVLCVGARIVAAMQVGDRFDESYRSLAWTGDEASAWAVHRLVVDPAGQGQGYAHDMMDFAEDHARRQGARSIRLDVYSRNRAAIRLYEGRGFEHRGTVRFPGRADVFHCMEKALASDDQ